LGHLSEKNNTPHVAYQTAVDCFEKNGITVGKDVQLQIAPAEGICGF